MLSTSLFFSRQSTPRTIWTKSGMNSVYTSSSEARSTLLEKVKKGHDWQ